MLADMNVECGTSKWKQAAGLGALFVLIYPVGIPAFFYFMLARNKVGY